ncbi:MAG: hypothetical protein NVS3B1_06240 [Marmoricola sp.]
MSKFYETENETRWWVGIYGRLILAIILLSLLSIGGYALSVALSPVKGRADQFKQQQSGTNRIFAQQQFHDLYADYQATVAKLPVYSQQAKSGDTAAMTNLTGLIAHCTDVVGQYNAASAKYLTKDFKDANLPVQLDYSACKVDRG